MMRSRQSTAVTQKNVRAVIELVRKHRCYTGACSTGIELEREINTGSAVIYTRKYIYVVIYIIDYVLICLTYYYVPYRYIFLVVRNIIE